MMDERFEVLKDLKFKYDSSYIKFSQHKLYKTLKLNDFKKNDHLIYENNNFFEFEIPTLNLFNILKLPISGGGYFRILPTFIFNYFFKLYSQKNKNFNFFIHPFELSNMNFDLPKNTPFLTKFRYNYKRNKVEKRLNQIIKLLKENNFNFKTFSQM